MKRVTDMYKEEAFYRIVQTLSRNKVKRNQNCYSVCLLVHRLFYTDANLVAFPLFIGKFRFCISVFDSRWKKKQEEMHSDGSGDMRPYM